MCDILKRNPLKTFVILLAMFLTLPYCVWVISFFCGLYGCFGENWQYYSLRLSVWTGIILFVAAAVQLWRLMRVLLREKCPGDLIGTRWYVLPSAILLMLILLRPDLTGAFLLSLLVFILYFIFAQLFPLLRGGSGTLFFQAVGMMCACGIALLTMFYLFVSMLGHRFGELLPLYWWNLLFLILCIFSGAFLLVKVLCELNGTNFRSLVCSSKLCWLFGFAVFLLFGSFVAGYVMEYRVRLCYDEIERISGRKMTPEVLKSLYYRGRKPNQDAVCNLFPPANKAGKSVSRATVVVPDHLEKLLDLSLNKISAMDYALLKEWCNKNQAAFEVIDQITESSFFLMNRNFDQPLFQMLLPEYELFRSWMKSYALRALLAVHDKKKESFAFLTARMKTLQGYAAEDIWVIGKLTGFALDRIRLQCLEYGLTRKMFSPDQLEALKKDLLKTDSELGRSCSDVLFVDAAAMKDFLERFRGFPENGFDVENYYMFSIRKLRLEKMRFFYSPLFYAMAKTHLYDVKNCLAIFPLTGKNYCTLELPLKQLNAAKVPQRFHVASFLEGGENVYDSMLLKFARESARLRLAAIAIAVEQFRIKHNKLPETLNELSPEFLVALPLDPFTGKTPVYRKEKRGFSLVSAGKDFMLAGGKTQGKSLPIQFLVER